MRAFVVSSPSTSISRFSDFSFLSPLPSSSFSFPLLLFPSRLVFFFLHILFSVSLLVHTENGGEGRWDFSKDDKTMRKTRRIRRSFGDRIEIEIETGIEGFIQKGGRRENAGESKREGRVHREYCVRCQCTP